MSEHDLEFETVGVTVRGWVQGVGFRIFVAMNADRLNVSGWVKNLPDGSVQLQATARRQALGKLIAAVGQGPPGSSVEQVETEKQKTPTGKGEGFRIL